ncbi:hypothetical protein M2317_002926 [Microbacterium sp. ZKA21]|uniref:hypothetical protein n=1 Tax=Microbacterium sp. ZKA21 TaxID=3381694 RepID=UPI003D1BEEE1
MSNVQAGERWGISKDSVRRHRDSHLSKALQAVAAQREAGGAVKAADRAELLYEKASAVLDAATEEGKASLSLAALRELRGIVELLAKLSGELDERPQVQVLTLAVSPEWQSTRAVLVQALAPFPEAAVAVSEALRAVEA